jgi:hypothetical protein
MHVLIHPYCRKCTGDFVEERGRGMYTCMEFDPEKGSMLGQPIDGQNPPNRIPRDKIPPDTPCPSVQCCIMCDACMHVLLEYFRSQYLQFPLRTLPPRHFALGWDIPYHVIHNNRLASTGLGLAFLLLGFGLCMT